MTADIDRWLAAALEAADAARAVIRPYFRTAVPADQKADQSPVTIADREAELAIRAVLRRRCPEHGILGEEYGLEHPDAPLRWVLDPIDGTRAFITGRPTFGSLIGLLEADQPVLGIIDQPVTGERWVGVRGRPTTFSGGLGGRIGTRACAALAHAELSATSVEMFGEALPKFRNVAGKVRRNYWGGDCYAYGLLALGHIDIVVECDLKPWDWAALVPVIEGAGGRMTGWQGQALRLDGDGRVIAVGDPSLLPAVVAALG